MGGSASKNDKEVREQKIGPCRVDSLMLKKERSDEQDWISDSKVVYRAIIYEFFGCYYHGCYKCYPNRKEFNKKMGMTMEELHFTTFQERFQFLQSQIENKVRHKTTDGLNYVIESCENIWECQFNDLVKSHSFEEAAKIAPFSNGHYHTSKLKELVSSSEFFSPLKARDAFVGGRTEKFCTRWHKKNCNQKFRYVDICSLYPYVNASCPYPVGHPDFVLVAPVFDENVSENPLSLQRRKVLASRSNDCIYCQPFSEVEQKILDEEYFGLIKCLVLPPRNLWIPIIPFKYNAKLFFPLCRKCVETTSSNKPQQANIPIDGSNCSHSDYLDRVFWGTFVTVELRLGIRWGYRVIDVSEIWSWSTARRSSNLFREYINTFLKIKTEASGWPVECNCDQTETCSHRRDFLRDFELKEGVKLNEENMERNEGLRFISKILLNSFWGYLGMRENLPKTRYVNNYPDVVKYFTSNFSRVIDATLVGEDLMLLQYQMIDDAADIPRKSNVVLAAFTTAHARSILYQHISKVKNPQNVLYCDTDSIMYIDEQVSGLDAHRDIPIGSYLGDMTDELPKTVTVDNFFSGGPKFYCINGRNNETAAEYNVFKVKGLTTNRAVEKTFDIEAFKKLVLQEVHELRSPFSSMRRCVKTGKIQTQFCKK